MAAMQACPQLLAGSAPCRASRRRSSPVAVAVAGPRASASLGGARATRLLQLCRRRGTSLGVVATAGDAPQLSSQQVDLPKRRIAVFVEVRRWVSPAVVASNLSRVKTDRLRTSPRCLPQPSPFSHTSGMKNRFLNMIANLQEQGDEVCAQPARRQREQQPAPLKARCRPLEAP